jgi:hypothetical protein
MGMSMGVAAPDAKLRGRAPAGGMSRVHLGVELEESRREELEMESHGEEGRWK